MIYLIKIVISDGSSYSTLSLNVTMHVKADTQVEALGLLKKELLKKGYSLIDNGTWFNHRNIARCIHDRGIGNYVEYVKETFVINPYNEEGEEHKVKFSKEEELLADEDYLPTLVANMFSRYAYPDPYVEHSSEIRFCVDNSVNRFVEINYEKWIENLDLSTDSGVLLEVEEFDLELGTLKVDMTGHYV